MLHLHVHALHLDHPAHLLRGRVARLPLPIYAEALHAAESTLAHLVLHLHRLRRLPLLHVVLEVVEDAVKVDGVELDGHFRRWVLRVVDHWWRFLRVVYL